MYLYSATAIITRQAFPFKRELYIRVDLSKLHFDRPICSVSIARKRWVLQFCMPNYTIFRKLEKCSQKRKISLLNCKIFFFSDKIIINPVLFYATVSYERLLVFTDTFKCGFTEWGYLCLWRSKSWVTELIKFVFWWLISNIFLPKTENISFFF